MVVEARKLVDDNNDCVKDTKIPVDALNALGYEEAAQHVYGMTYGEWKTRHQKKATDEQMERYKASEPIQAKHDKQLLAKRGEKPSSPPVQNTKSSTQTVGATGNSTNLMSNVCCQDVDDVTAATTTSLSPEPTAPTKDEPDNNNNASKIAEPYQPPPIPPLTKPVQIAVLTVSDRAFRNEYATGDLSGPAVVEAVQQIMSASTTPNTPLTFVPIKVVPDDVYAIQQAMKDFTKEADIILTTGGTGMSPRDVTPEATEELLKVELSGLMSFIAVECSRVQPLATLTRGTAGILPLQTLVANLPGNPKAVGEIMPMLLPLLLHALEDLRAALVPP